MSKDKIYTATPLRTYELRPTQVKTTGWFSSSLSSDATTPSDRIFGVFETTEDATSDGLKEVSKYFVDTAANSTFPIWPSNSNQVIAIFPQTTNVENIVDRKATSVRSISQTHSLIGRHMCTVSSVRPQSAFQAQGEWKSKADDMSLQEWWVGSGLGHGQWSDSTLEKALGFPDRSDGFSIKEDRVEWRAQGDQWQTRLSQKYRDISWGGKGRVSGGGLILTGADMVLAVYKPRCARWEKKGDAADDGQEKGEIIGDGVSVGVLGICHEKVDDEMTQHILLSAVAIEEQIMRSKGFDPLKYHGMWD
ncbi:hypothetical protein BU24DRAFT_491853 [Aaosphaeria arxii CBS 175.79]|uniref:Uncharacterized protein n=1 Tax=Aaosphaeria arxii CBS 175.79 TaxID=1450172 RepID=A0A6A5XQS5_9PLEO|nr:uncharacterized protein BU24DRAFT_491853 [Aaosphaeria arxii CBS 175.79]KAF2015635.1 hypothetical protein BU24DRAFT_491853 [Aaosphaeria arxii CBS 175.79]